MKKIILFALLICGISFSANAQKFALIDMEYILNKVPAYEQANQKLESYSKSYQAKVEQINKQAAQLYKDYQAKASSMSSQARSNKENEIIAKEKQAAELRNKYFGQNGEMFKLKEKLMKPIQDKIYQAVKSISIRYGYKAVIDRASNESIIFASPDIDISDQVLSTLGY